MIWSESHNSIQESYNNWQMRLQKELLNLLKDNLKDFVHIITASKSTFLNCVNSVLNSNAQIAFLFLNQTLLNDDMMMLIFL